MRYFRTAITDLPHPEQASGASASKDAWCRCNAPASLLHVAIGIDQRAGRISLRCQHGLGVHLAELLGIVPLDVVELDRDHARLRPFAVRAELHVADDG